MSAAITSDIEMARLLLAYNADPSHTNYLGYSALRYALFNDDPNDDRDDVAPLIQDALDALNAMQEK